MSSVTSNSISHTLCAVMAPRIILASGVENPPSEAAVCAAFMIWRLAGTREVECAYLVRMAAIIDEFYPPKPASQ